MSNSARGLAMAAGRPSRESDSSIVGAKPAVGNQCELAEVVLK